MARQYAGGFVDELRHAPRHHQRELRRGQTCTFKAHGVIGGAILHSDRGSQYTSEAFLGYGMRQSLSGVAHCYDSARMESFFATLKKELIYRIPAYRMKMEEVKALVFRCVFVYYNRQRVYTANPGRTAAGGLQAGRRATGGVAAGLQTEWSAAERSLQISPPVQLWVFFDCTFLDNSKDGMF